MDGRGIGYPGECPHPVMDQLSQADVRYLGVLVNHLAARITEGCLGVCTRQPEIPVSWS